MVAQQNEALHHVHGLPGHRKHLGHEVAVTFEEGDGTQLDVEQQSRHPGEGLQVLLAFVGRGGDQRLQTLRLDGHLAGSENERLSLVRNVTCSPSLSPGARAA